MTKEAYMLGPNGTQEALPKYILFHNDTQAFEVSTEVNEHAGDY